LCVWPPFHPPLQALSARRAGRQRRWLHEPKLDRLQIVKGVKGSHQLRLNSRHGNEWT
jgi:ATP-dependent DNA ligase